MVPFSVAKSSESNYGRKEGCALPSESKTDKNKVNINWQWDKTFCGKEKNVFHLVLNTV